jgi:hypothetical protein
MKAPLLTLNTTVPLPLAIWLLVLVDCLYHHFIHELSWFQSFPLALVEGGVCGAILWMTTRLDLARVSICYLALPYVFFIPGWLNTPTAILLSVIFIYSLWRTLRNTHSVRENSITVHSLAAFLAILLWVNLSGAGGYGFQISDWMMHNARLHDLTQLAWPVRYGEDQNLVYYVGYFLPAAIVGKLTSLDLGIRSLFPWTVLGVVLAIRWLSVLSQWRMTVVLVLVFALFGPLDLLNVLFMNLSSPTTLENDLSTLMVNTDFLDFRLWHSLGFFIGNYLSNTFQLYWSPQQVISGWLGMGLLTYLFFKGQLRSLLFVYALLCLWAPFAMIALLPFIIFAVIRQLRSQWQLLLTFENGVGAAALAIVFVTFYTSGSTSANLAFWIFSKLHGPGYLTLLIFYLFAWGLYAITISPVIRQEERIEKLWFLCLLFSLLTLPLYVFGDYADLLCRGSAPLMFLLLVFLLRALQHYWEQQRLVLAGLLICLLLIGTGSALLQNRTALTTYGKTQPVRSIIDYHNAFPNLGPDHSPFERWFRKKLP